jgi:hypothetical protein
MVFYIYFCSIIEWAPYLPLVIWPKKCAITELRKLACIGKENQSSANIIKNLKRCSTLKKLLIYER